VAEQACRPTSAARAGSPGSAAYDEKNIRRRVYDALNVLMAMDIISKDKKEIRWQGLPSTPEDRGKQLRAERAKLRARLMQQHGYLRARARAARRHPCHCFYLQALTALETQCAEGPERRHATQVPCVSAHELWHALLQELAKQQTAYRNLIMRHASTPAGQLAAASAAGAAAPMPLPLPFILIQVRAGWRPGCMPS